MAHVLAAARMDDRTETVYGLFLARPTLRGSEVVDRLGWPEADVGHVLDQLVRLGVLYADRRDGEEVFRLARPDVGLSLLLTLREAELTRRQGQVEAARAAVSALAARTDTGWAHHVEAIERFQGEETLRARLWDLMFSAREEILLLLPARVQAPDAFGDASLLDKSVAERGVAVRRVYQYSVRNDPRALEYAEGLVRDGAEVRTAPALPVVLLIVDRKAAVIEWEPGRGQEGTMALEMHSPGAVDITRLLFDTYWEAGTPLGDTPPTDRNSLTPQERELLRLLAVGNTDASVSRRMGISLRTVRRMYARLMDRLQVKSRFEAGVEATRRGWIP
ncbi:helix-turn-helix transcriptional regulator [Streptomyces sp. NPDC006368]|uniref:helix-turn-helix transcriptional regulator n=1 Tax=Streptomyces sp. NPDC006368 TaxID=3156760 RepID=UPI0033AE8686